MAKKTVADKSDKGSASADKHAGDKTPVEPVKNAQEPEDLEPYTPTGNFEADFCELAIRAGFPTMQVVPRPHRPPTPTPTPPEPAPVTGKGDKDKSGVKEELVKQEEGTSTGEPEEPPPATYTVKDKYTYFKPRVEVELEEEGNKSHVKEIYMRGWKIDDRILEILTVTLPPLEKLTKLDMWNNCLTDSSLNILANAVQNLPNLRTLCLDNNPLTLQRYGVLLGEESKIQHLSLRNCYINNMGAKMIGNALTTNKSLVTLNLCFNKITCEGAEKLVKVGNIWFEIWIIHFFMFLSSSIGDGGSSA
ncbi:leucine-rich repeat-containing protein 71-like, partial [Actinia tenebrosa]|uniref:Leucine-rich repeat-containing protein 71-like n=1 Tax=Actinia tenebrosa TaxID=6105 RepID=A0A6P8H3M0_ACTTE